MSADKLQTFLQILGGSTMIAGGLYIVALRQRINGLLRQRRIMQLQISQLESERYSRFFTTPDGQNGR